MSSARRESVQRHIDNENIHGGEGKAIPFVEYSIGRREGKYQVKQKPQFASSDPVLLIRLVRKIRLHVEDEIAKEIAKRICRKKIDDSFYNMIEPIATMHIWDKLFDEVFRPSR